MKMKNKTMARKKKNELKRVLTRNVGFLDHCTRIALEDLPYMDAEQLLICVLALYEYRAKRDEMQRFIDYQKAEITAILRRLHRNPLGRDLVVYSIDIAGWLYELRMDYNPADYPDGIVFASCAQYYQERLDVMKMKRIAPETYKMYLKKIRCKGKITTGRDIANLKYYIDGGSES